MHGSQGQEPAVGAGKELTGINLPMACVSTPLGHLVT